MKTKRSRQTKYSKEQLIGFIHRACEILGRQVSYAQMDALKGFPSANAFHNQFGKWSNALSAAGLSVRVGPSGKKGSAAAKRWGKQMALINRKPVLKNPYATHRMRFEVLHRDNFTCQYCGRTPQDGAKLVVDHKLAAKNGGETRAENLITSCFECNSGKRDIILHDHLPRHRPKKKGSSSGSGT